jgi:hypothetical protein
MTAGLLLAAAGLAAPPVGAYSLRETESGATVRWPAGERIALRLDASLAALGDSDDVAAALSLAIAEWEGEGLGDVVVELEPATGAAPGFALGGANHNDVVAVERGWPYDPRASAMTVLTYDADYGVILDADILFNAQHFRWNTGDAPSPGTVDLADVATHELGHLLGLAHSEVAEATMFERNTRGSVTRRDLHDDDVAAIGALYGDDARLAVAAGCVAAPAAPRGGAATALGVLAFATILGFRQRRRADAARNDGART